MAKHVILPLEAATEAALQPGRLTLTFSHRWGVRTTSSSTGTDRSRVPAPLVTGELYTVLAAFTLIGVSRIGSLTQMKTKSVNQAQKVRNQ